MIYTHLNLNIEGRKFFDKLAGEKVRVTDFRAIIEFPAPYAVYAFNSPYGSPKSAASGSRQIREKSILRRGSDIRKDFETHYLKNFSVPGAINFATRNHLKEVRRYELRAPGPRPPRRNPHDDRLRRITGKLADTAHVPRQATKVTPGGGSRYVSVSDSRKFARRLARSTTFNIGANIRQR